MTVKKGDKVHYHSIIGGRHNGEVYTVSCDPKSMCGSEVVWLDGRPAPVAVEALSPAYSLHGNLEWVHPVVRDEITTELMKLVESESLLEIVACENNSQDHIDLAILPLIDNAITEVVAWDKYDDNKEVLDWFSGYAGGALAIRFHKVSEILTGLIREITHGKR